MAERKFEIAASAVYIDVPCVEYVRQRLQDRPEFQFVVVVFDVLGDLGANALNFNRNRVIVGFAGHRDLHQ